LSAEIAAALRRHTTIFYLLDHLLTMLRCFWQAEMVNDKTLLYDLAVCAERDRRRGAGLVLNRRVGRGFGGGCARVGSVIGVLFCCEWVGLIVLRSRGTART